MKAVKGVIICTLLGVIFQNLIFFYVEKVYLTGSSNYNIQRVDNDAGIENLETEISSKAEDVRTSYDGKYISYREKGELIICSSKDGSKNKYKPSAGELVYYKWLTDCNKIIVIEKVIDNGDTYFVPISYDAKTTQVNEITDFDMKEVKIKSNTQNAKIGTVAFSTASSSLYIKVEEENGKSNLYYANQMNQLEKVKSNAEIGNIAVPTTSSNAVLELENKIAVINGSSNISIPNLNNPKIIGADKNDKVYFCDDKDGKTNIIYYANLAEKKYKWSKIKLKSEESLSNIYIDYSGKIYINNSSEKKVKELTSNKEIEYKGDFLQTYSGGIISRKGSTVIKNVLS